MGVRGMRDHHVIALCGVGGFVAGVGAFAMGADWPAVALGLASVGAIVWAWGFEQGEENAAPQPLGRWLQHEPKVTLMPSPDPDARAFVTVTHDPNTLFISPPSGSCWTADEAQGRALASLVIHPREMNLARLYFDALARGDNAEADDWAKFVRRERYRFERDRERREYELQALSAGGFLTEPSANAARQPSPIPSDIAGGDIEETITGGALVVYAAFLALLARWLG